MLESEKLALAAHLHVVLRRQVGRVTDVEWLIKDMAYAREIIALALSSPHEDCQSWARKLEAALFPPAPRPAVRPEHSAAASAAPLSSMVRRYVGSLR